VPAALIEKNQGKWRDFNLCWQSRDDGQLGPRTFEFWTNVMDDDDLGLAIKHLAAGTPNLGRQLVLLRHLVERGEPTGEAKLVLEQMIATLCGVNRGMPAARTEGQFA
jgi:hypothetical protein